MILVPLPISGPANDRDAEIIAGVAAAERQLSSAATATDRLAALPYGHG
jgi:hypothetical protein